MTRKEFFARVGFGAAGLLLPACVAGLATSCSDEDEGTSSSAPSNVDFTEDVSSGATAYMLDKILVEQKSYFTLDSAPETLSAKDHRPPYGSDGDYFSKPSIDDIFEKVYGFSLWVIF